MLFEDIYTDITTSFSSLWKIKQHGESLEIITPFATTNNRFVSLFLSQRNKKYIVSDGGYISEGLYENQFNTKNECFGKLYIHYIKSFEIKQTKNENNNDVFYKTTENPLAIPSIVLDMSNYISAIVSASEIAEKDTDRIDRFSRIANDYIRTIVPPNEFAKQQYLDQANKEIKLGAIITKSNSKLILVNYLTGTTPENFVKSIGKNLLMFRMANQSTFRTSILKNISVVDDGARGFSEQINNTIDFTSQDTKSTRVNWSGRERLIDLLKVSNN